MGGIGVDRETNEEKFRLIEQGTRLIVICNRQTFRLVMRDSHIQTDRQAGGKSESQTKHSTKQIVIQRQAEQSSN